MFPLYTKTFGEKIGKKLQSDSPDSCFIKKFKMASLKIFPPKTCKQSLVQKKIENETVISSSTLKKPMRHFSIKPSFPNQSLKSFFAPKHSDLPTFLHEIVFTCKLNFNMARETNLLCGKTV